MWRLGDVAVPVPDGDTRLLTQLVQALKLVVDERLQRPDVQCAHGAGRILGEERQNREKGGLGLAGGGGGAEQEVVLPVSKMASPAAT